MSLEEAPLALPHEARESYRALLAEALRGIKDDPGSETTFQHLIALEKWMGKTFGEGALRVSDETERGIAQEYRGGKRKTQTISDLLDRAGERIASLMERAVSPKHLADALNIVFSQEAKTLLPPGEGEVHQGSGAGMEKREYAPRLEALIELLRRHNIFTDDLILTVGKNSPGMMRTESYVLVEIPRLGKNILVCNEVDEATFLSERSLGIDCYFRSTKEELLGYPGVHKIIFNNPDQWERDIIALFFREGEPVGEKINVGDFSAFRRETLRQHSAQEWVEWNTKQKLKFKLHGKGLNAAARLFGVEGNPVNNTLSHLELGAHVYGEEDPVIKPLLARAREKVEMQDTLGEDAAKWREEIRKKISPADWVGMDWEQRRVFNFYGKGLNAFPPLFGIEVDPRGSALHHLELGAHVYGEEDPVIKPLLARAREKAEMQDTLGEDAAKWREEIRKKIS